MPAMASGPGSGSGHEDGDVVGRAGGQGDQQGVARLADGQPAEGGEGAGQAPHAGVYVGGGVLDEPVGVQQQGAAGGQVQPGGPVGAVGQAAAQGQAGRQ